MTRPKIRPATATDFLAFFGHPPKNTIKAIVVDIDGKVIGMGGIERHRGFYVAFSDISDDLRARKVVLMKAARAVIDLVKQCPLPVVTIQNTEEKTSRNFLTHLGFVPTEEPEVFLWPGSQQQHHT